MFVVFFRLLLFAWLPLLLQMPNGSVMVFTNNNGPEYVLQDFHQPVTVAVHLDITLENVKPKQHLRLHLKQMLIMEDMDMADMVVMDTEDMDTVMDMVITLPEAHKDLEVSDLPSHTTDTVDFMVDMVVHTLMVQALPDTQEEQPHTSPEAYRVLASKS